MKAAFAISLLFLFRSISILADPIVSANTINLEQMDIEDLMKVEVTTSGRKAQQNFSVPAAITVITQEDIRRSGANSIPEALRGVPGVDVARINANQWAVSIRGFNGRFADKLLVMINGRSIYSNYFSGVFWEEQDVLLPDVERIEVIRGPGGTLWGANAVNGIINIITKSSSDTKGDLVQVSAGNEQSGTYGFRHGGGIGKKGSFRIWGSFTGIGASVTPAGDSAHDGWSSLRGGFRSDWKSGEEESFTLEGNLFHNRVEEMLPIISLTPPELKISDKTSPMKGYDLQGRWTKHFANQAEISIQAFVDSNSMTNFLADLKSNTFDLDVQHRFAVQGQHFVMLGVGYRHIHNRLDANADYYSIPPSADYNLFNSFIQDEILLKKNVKLTVGSKFEHNSFTGFEWQPSVRIACTPDQKHTLWAAFTRSLRTVAQADTNSHANFGVGLAPDGTTLLYTSNGNPNLQAQVVQSYELGYRMETSSQLMADFTAFYNHYRKVRAINDGIPFFDPSPVPHVVVPLYFSNSFGADTFGLESTLHWKPTSKWSTNLSWTLLSDVRDGERAGIHVETLNYPHNQISLKSHLDLPNHFELDTSLYWTSRINDLAVPSNTRLDCRLGWRPSSSFELSLVGQNLLTNHTQEFGFFDLTNNSIIQRSVSGIATWHF